MNENSLPKNCLRLLVLAYRSSIVTAPRCSGTNVWHNYGSVKMFHDAAPQVLVEYIDDVEHKDFRATVHYLLLNPRQRWNDHNTTA